MAGWFRNEDGTSSSGGGRGGAATIAASAVSGSSRRTRGKALLRPVFALSALALVVFLALDDDQAGFGGPKPAASRRGLKLEGNGEEERVYPDGTVVRIVVDEHGERFAGVRYADDDRDLGGDGDLRGDASSSDRKLNHVEGHVLVQLSYGKDPDVECALLAELVGGTVEYVLKGGAFNGCSIIPSEFAMQSADGTLPLTGESGVDAVEEDGIVEAYQTQNWEIWNLNRIDQCTLPLEEGSYAKEDASAILGSASPIGSGMNLATKMDLNCGPDTSKPTRKPTKSPTMTPTLPPTPKPTSRPTPTCIQKNRLLGKTSEVCLGGRRLTTACCSGRCFDPNHRGRAYCR